MESPFSDQLNSTGREYGLMSGRRLSRSSKKKMKGYSTWFNLVNTNIISF